MQSKNTDDENDWGDYMEAKKRKLEEQFEEDANLKNNVVNIFKGTSIFVNGHTIPSADELRNLMLEYGGIYHHYYSTNRTKFMVASNLPDVKIKKYLTSNIKIIKPQWVVDCIQAGKLIDYKPYLLLNELTNISRLGFFKKVVPADVDSKLDQTAVTTSTSNTCKTAKDDNFISEFYNNSRLHHISTMGTTFKQHVNELRAKCDQRFEGRDRFKKWKFEHFPNETRSVENCVMHIDMDCFFVSVGLRKNPELKGCPVAVTHAKGNRRRNVNSEDRMKEMQLHEQWYKNKYGIDDDKIKENSWFGQIGEHDSMSEVASCSYEARKCGIKNGMLLGHALKLCPNLKTIPYDFEGYNEVSYALYNHIASFTLDIEAVSCDEMYVDCTDILVYANATPLEFATFLRNEIKELTGCPCSTGFGSNRLLARLATKKAKPDGQFHVESEKMKQFMESTDISELPGVGHSTADKLAQMGIKTCKDLQNTPLSKLQEEFGNKSGLTLYNHGFGEDDRPLNFGHVRKSVSADVNYGIRFEKLEDVEKFLRNLSTEVEMRLNNIGMKGKSITLKLMTKTSDAPTETAKYLGHGICNYVTKTVSLLSPTSSSDIIWREVLKIVRRLEVEPKDMRGIGIQVSRLENRKNASNNLDKFVVKLGKPVQQKTEEVRNGNESNVPKPESSNNESAESSRSDTYSEDSSMDITLSQVDHTFLEALPDDIRRELVTNLRSRNLMKQRKLKNTNQRNGTSFGGNRAPCIIMENNIPRLNPKIPATDVTKAIDAWLSSGNPPQNIDVSMLTHYLRQLVQKKEYEKSNYIIGYFQRLICQNESECWKVVYQKVSNVVREEMRNLYGHCSKN